MIELNLGPTFRHLPYTIRLYDVTEEMFDEIVDEDTKAEYIDGVMIVHSPASLRHDYVSGFIRSLLNDYAEAHDLGVVFGPDALVRLRTGRRFAPDAFFVPRDQVAIPLPKQYHGVPALVVEVLSSSNREEDLHDKRPAYHEAGVNEIWIVDLEEQVVLVDYRQKKGYKKSRHSSGKVLSKIIPDFWLDTDWLWSEPLPKRLPCLQQILRSAKP
ncbi:MAG: Uma2 family endonuclease [Gemmataceae bacterium]